MLANVLIRCGKLGIFLYINLANFWRRKSQKKWETHVLAKFWQIFEEENRKNYKKWETHVYVFNYFNAVKKLFLNLPDKLTS